MKEWLKISLLLSAFGFFKEFRPSEHFIYEYLTDPKWNITEDVINQEVYPIATYSYLAQLVIVFLITDLCRYKPLIIILALSGVTVFSLLIWTTTLFALQAVEVIYGTLMSTEVAYYTYIYAKVPKEKYQIVTGHTRAGILIGRFASGLIGQLLISYKVMTPMSLTYLSLGALIIGTLWSFFLPSVEQSIYFHHSDTKSMRTRTEKWSYATKLVSKHFISSYSTAHVIKWSIWWALATCGYLLVQTYMQPLWHTIQPGTSSIYNGAVEAILTLLGTAGALLAGFIKTDWKVKGEFILALCSIVEGAALILASQATDVFVAYGCYIFFGALYHFMITIASAEIAKHILTDSYGLVFGLNTFLALVVQTILIIIIISDSGLGYGKFPRYQYLVYGGYFMFIGGVFIIMGIFEWVKLCRRRKEENVPN